MIKIIKSIYTYLFLTLALLVGFFWYKRQKISHENPTDAANNLLDDFQISNSQKPYYNQIARDVANNLGTSYHWADPRHWTENDKVVFELLNGLSKLDFNIVAELYNKVYARGYDLRVDLSKMLDSKYYVQLHNL